MAKCYKCNNEIEDDSRYCDVCGALLYVCPTCHRIGKGEGKRCGYCGKLLVPATETDPSGESATSHPADLEPTYPIGTSLSPSEHTATIPARSASFATMVPNQNPTSTIVVPPTARCLYCESEDVRLTLIDNAIVGRVNGNYSHLLGSLIYISGTHAKIEKIGQDWTITDLGSRNGTAINGMVCRKGETRTFKIGDIIRIANYYDFIVE